MLAEDFSAYNKDDQLNESVTNSHTGTQVYGDGSVTYSCEDGTYTSSGKTKTAVTRIFEENTGGGTSPELFVGKNAGTFTIENIPTGSASALTLTYKSNKDPKLSSPTTGVSLGNNQPTGVDKNHTVDISIPDNTTSFDLVFTAPSDNARLDDILIVVKTAGVSSCSADPIVGAASVNGSFFFKLFGSG